MAAYHSTGDRDNFNYPWTTSTNSYIVQDEDTDSNDFKSLVAFKGLKIIEANEINGCIHLKCKRGQRVFNIETNATYAEMFNSKKESIIQIGLRFVKSIFNKPTTSTNPWYTTTTNATNDYIWSSTVGGNTAIC